MKTSCSIAKSLKYSIDYTASALRKFFAVLVLLFVFAPVQAQYFNERIDFMGYNQAEVGFSIEEMVDGNFIIFHGGYNELGDRVILARTIINPAGEVVDYLQSDHPASDLYIGWSNTSHKSIDGGFITSGSRFFFFRYSVTCIYL